MIRNLVLNPKIYVSMYFMTSDVIIRHQMTSYDTRCHSMTSHDIWCQELYWYTCFWNQHWICDHLSLFWTKSENVVKQLFFFIQWSPLGILKRDILFKRSVSTSVKMSWTLKMATIVQGNQSLIKKKLELIKNDRQILNTKRDPEWPGWYSPCGRVV